jgi:DNA-directed RNA polymerase subunit RPC12/RpoP
MPAITVVCPECEGKMKASADAEGRKVRCKACGHVFVVPRGAAAKVAQPASQSPGGQQGPATTGARKPRKRDEDEGDGKPYDVTTLNLTPRCPECAADMEEGGIICLTCGYNTMTRERAPRLRTQDLTDVDYFIYRLPGILCFGLAMYFLGGALWWCLYIEGVAKGMDMSWVAHNGIKLWVVIMCLFGAWHSGKFALRRLILHPKPPEKEIV